MVSPSSCVKTCWIGTIEKLAVLLQCFELFSKALSDRVLPKSLENGNTLDTEQEARKEWFAYTLAQLRAFARKYHAPAAPLLDSLENSLYAEGAVPHEIRDSLVQSLHP